MAKVSAPHYLWVDMRPAKFPSAQLSLLHFYNSLLRNLCFCKHVTVKCNNVNVALHMLRPASAMTESSCSIYMLQLQLDSLETYC